MIQCKGYAAVNAQASLAPYAFKRRDVKPDDVMIDIKYCGVCHSDLHQCRNEWGGSIYPMVPGHEIVGTVRQVGSSVKNFKVGDSVGVGCMVDSCRTCGSCHDGLEQYCEGGFVGTYNSYERGSKDLTYGGYSDKIVVDQRFVLKIAPNLDLKKAAPLLCAGITTYSPLKRWGVGPGKKVAIVGLGGLGHMGVKIARAMGAHVAVVTSSPGKSEDAMRLGAHEVIVSKDAAQLTKKSNYFDFILDTVSADHDLNLYLQMLKRDGTLCLVGLPPEPAKVIAAHFILGRRQLTGSLIGGLPETQEMLDFCAKHQITSDIELIPMQQINSAYERMVRNDVKYRFVIDVSTI